ncbi:MAG: serine/threonine protein kinase, partial [Myxococcota bacterium]
PADVFGLGVIFFELLSGQRPFPFLPRSSRTWQADARTYLKQRIALADQGDLALPPALLGVSEQLASIVTKALRPNPRQRQGDARELGRDVRMWLETGQGIEDEADDTIAAMNHSAMNHSAMNHSAVIKLRTDLAAPPPIPSIALRQNPPSILERAATGPGWRMVLGSTFVAGGGAGVLLYYLLGG